MRKRALAAAVLLLSCAAGAWWFLARSEAPDDGAHGRAPDAAPRADLSTAESAAPPAIDATRTENRDVAAATSGAIRSADAFASGATNWDQAATTSGIELDVIDATTRERLRDVTLEQGGEDYESATSRELPGGGPHAMKIAADAERHPVAHGDAPLRIQLPPKMRRGRIRYLIGAPGHATVARWYDVSISGWRRHVVALAAGGPLDVVVRGDGAPQRGWVELYCEARLARRVRPSDAAGEVARSLRRSGADVSFAFETTPDADQVARRIDALPCGDWIAVATFGSEGEAVRHEVAPFRVEAGDDDGHASRVQIALGSAPPPRCAEFRGTVRFAAGWTAEEIAAVHLLEFTRLDDGSSFEPPERFVGTVSPTSDDHRLAFDAQRHCGGLHAVAFDAIPAVLEAVLDETTTDPDGAGAGASAVELFLDEPASVTLRARDRSGAPREIVLFRFVAGPAAARVDRAGGRLATQSDGMTRPFRVPRGPFHFETEPRASVAFVERDVDLVAGENLLDVVVSDYAGVRLALRDGAVPMPWTFGTEIVVARAEAPRDPIDVRRRTTLLGSECQIDLEAPCRYVVSVLGVPGFEDPEPVEFAVESGQIAPVEIVLTTPR